MRILENLQRQIKTLTAYRSTQEASKNARDHALRTLSAVPLALVEEWKSRLRAPVEARIILEAACVALGMILPKPGIGDNQTLANQYSALLFADWGVTMRKCEEMFYARMAAPVLERLHRVLSARDCPTLDWALRTNRRGPRPPHALVLLTAARRRLRCRTGGSLMAARRRCFSVARAAPT